MNDENVDPDKSNDRLYINNSYQPSSADNHDRSFQTPEFGNKCAPELSAEASDKTINDLDSVSQNMTSKSKSTYQREWYKKMNPEQRNARNEREKMARLEGKRACK